MQKNFSMNYEIELYEKLTLLSAYILHTLYVICAYSFEWFSINFYLKVKQVSKI